MDAAEMKILRSYKALLEQLNPTMKLKLVKFLEVSAKSKKLGESRMKLSFGAWNSQETADEIIDEIYQNRHTNRQIEEL